MGAKVRLGEGHRPAAVEYSAMDAPHCNSKPWWRLSRLEAAGAAVGAATGLIAAAPLLWLAAESHRIGDAGLSAAARFQPWDLLTVWAMGAIVGGLLAAVLTRIFVALRSPQGEQAPTRQPSWVGYLVDLLLGALIIMVVAPAPAALVLSALRQGAGNEFLAFYVVAGGLVGWQSGVIALVFLYTFQTLDQIRRSKESNP